MIQKKWSKFGTSIFTTMTLEANRYGAINLAQGFPNFDGPEKIKDAAVAAIRSSSSNQYAPSAGLPELRTLLAKRMQKVSGVAFDPDTEITVFSGATEALFCSFLALFQEGDEILTFAPYFDCYPAGAFAVKANLSEIALLAPHWTFTESDITAKITPKTRAILVNTPHNPSGRVFTRDEMLAISRVACKHDLIVITDEVYDELIFDGQPFTRMATLPNMRDRTITISSTAKTFSFTGWKVGFAFACKAITDELRAVHQFTVFCSATPLQKGLCRALEMADDYYDLLRKEYTERRDYLYSELSNLGFSMRNAAGTYFLLADYSHMSDLPDKEFSLWLTQNKKVAVIPTSVFYNNPEDVAKRQHYVRFAFCKDLKTLEAGIKNLR